MTARKIVRDAAILSGRWRFEGTMTPVADVRNDFYIGHDGPLETYRFAGLSAEDVHAALAFIFPPLREPTVELKPTVVVVHCSCGETTEQFSAGWPESEVDCVCGRCWHVRLVIEAESAAGAELKRIG
jgi:uncharacterized protein (DUF433 family)